MIRLVIALLHLTGILFINFLLGGDANVQINVPGKINAGNEITVQVTVNKGDISGFSRFQMDLPDGITASSQSSANADFSFKDQKVRLIWLRLPDDETITFSFVLQCNERLKGNFNLIGRFSYIDNNERKTVDTDTKQVAIVPNPNIDPSLLVDINDFGKSAYPSSGSELGQIACIREQPKWNEQQNQVMVTILVNKESLQKFAKIEEVVPAGYTALNIDSKNGIFTFKDNHVKFLWMTLPSEPYFTVSYKLIPMNGQTPKVPDLKGTFSYIVEDKTKSIDIVEKDVNLSALTPELVKSILQQPAVMVAANTNQQSTQTNPATAQNIKPADSAKTNLVANNKVPTAKNTANNNTQVSRPVTSSVSDLLEPQSGIYYRVQIAAGHAPVNIKRYFRKYKLDNTVLKEQHDGWYKYSIGSFPLYKEARDYRVHIWNTTSIDDAFVAAYNDGKRITVQEALMIANQQWYQ